MSEERNEGPFEKIGEAVGGAVGRAAGRANDLAMNAVRRRWSGAWERVGRERHGDWSEVRDQVSYGFTYREPGAPNPT